MRFTFTALLLIGRLSACARAHSPAEEAGKGEWTQDDAEELARKWGVDVS